MIYKKSYIICILILSVFSCIAQEKSTTYYDAYWNETTKEDATYYRKRPLEKKNDSVLVKDYYMNGTLQFEGWAHDYNEDYYLGKAIWYFENGKKQVVRNYEYGSLNGESLEYYDTGELKKIENYEDDNLEGEAKVFNKKSELIYNYTNKYGQPHNGYTECLMLYKNGKSYDRKILYDSTGEIAFEKKCIDGKCISTVTNINGKELGQFVVEKNILDGIMPEYYFTNCSTAKSLKSLITFKNGKKEGEALFFDENEKVLHKGEYKNDLPYSGTFYTEDYGLEYFTSYKNGQKEGVETIFNSEGLLAKGEYSKGKRINGKFLIEEEFEGNNSLKLIIIKNGKEEGKQQYYNFGEIAKSNLKGYYFAKNGELDGEKVVYNDYPEILFQVTYKNGQPFEGYIVADKNAKESQVYKNGKFVGIGNKKRISNTNYWDVYNDNNELTREEHPNFLIEGKEKIIGFYKNGVPYNGYFMRPGAKLYILDYYESGEKKYQYSELTTIFDGDETSKNYDEEFEHSPPIKSVYKNGEIFDGIEFDFSKHSLSKKTLKNGTTQSLSLYVFAMHYANVINITTTDTGYTITEAKHPKIKIIAEKGTISFTYDDKIVHSKIKNELANLTIIYSIKNDTIIPIKKWNEDLFYTQKFLETYKSDLLGQYYTKLGPSDYSATNVFLKLKEQNNQEDLDTISSISYDSEGLPYYGMLIEEYKTKYQGTIYKEGVKGKTLKNATLKDLNEFYEKNY